MPGTGKLDSKRLRPVTPRAPPRSPSPGVAQDQRRGGAALPVRGQPGAAHGAGAHNGGWRGGRQGACGVKSGPGLRPPNLCLCECGGAGPRARRCLPPGARPTDLLSCPSGRMASPSYPTLQRRRHSITPTPPHTHCVSSKVQRRRSTAPPTPLPRAQPPGALPGGHPQPGARGPRHPRPPGALKHSR